MSPYLVLGLSSGCPFFTAFSTEFALVASEMGLHCCIIPYPGIRSKSWLIKAKSNYVEEFESEISPRPQVHR